MPAKKKAVEFEGTEELDKIKEKVKTDGQGYYFSPEQLYQLILTVMSLKQVRNISIFKARQFLVSNKGIVISLLEEYAKKEAQKSGGH